MEVEFKLLLGMSRELNEQIEKACSKLHQSKSAFVRDGIRRRLQELAGDQGQFGRGVKEGQKRPRDEPRWIGVVISGLVGFLGMIVMTYFAHN